MTLTKPVLPKMTVYISLFMTHCFLELSVLDLLHEFIHRVPVELEYHKICLSHHLSQFWKYSNDRYILYVFCNSVKWCGTQQQTTLLICSYTCGILKTTDNPIPNFLSLYYKTNICWSYYSFRFCSTWLVYYIGKIRVHLNSVNQRQIVALEGFFSSKAKVRRSIVKIIVH